MKEKAIPAGYMTIGAVAAKMGVTVRALQYYDKEGLLPPATVSEGGRRLYTDKEVVRLHQILSLRSLGFSLAEIKDRLIGLDSPAAVAAALAEQAELVRGKLAVLKDSLSQLEALRAEVLQIQTVDFKKYADIIVNLQMKNDAYRLIKYFDDKTLDHIRTRFDKDSGLAMIATFTALRDKAIRYRAEGVPPDGAAGQALAAEFWSMIDEFTGGDMSLLPRLMQIGDTLGEGEWQRDQQLANTYIEAALGAYFDAQGVDPFKESEQ